MESHDNRTGIYHTVGGETREIRIDLLDSALVEVYRGWTPERRIEVGANEMRFVRQFLRAAIVERHPEWTEAQIRSEIARRIRGDAG